MVVFDMSTRDIYNRLQDSIRRQKILHWSKDADDVSWRLPNDDFPSLRSVKEVIIAENERVALFQQGSFLTILRPGKRELDERADELFFIDVSEKTGNIGFKKKDHPLTTNNQSFGFSGSVTFKVLEDNASIGGYVESIGMDHSDVNVRLIINTLREGILFQAFREILLNYTYDELCWFLAEKIEKATLGMPSLEDIRRKAEKLFHSSISYDELCWLNGEIDVLLGKGLIEKRKIGFK